MSPQKMYMLVYEKQQVCLLESYFGVINGYGCTQQKKKFCVIAKAANSA